MSKTINIEDLSELNLFEVIEGYNNPLSIDELLTKDITYFGLIQSDWIKDKGKRTERTYSLLSENGSEIVCIKDVYEYTLTGASIDSYIRKIQYLKSDGSVGIEKVVSNDHSIGKLTKLNRDVRMSQIDGLREKGKQLAQQSLVSPEPYKTFFLNVSVATDTLLDHYLDVITKGYVFGFNEFIEAMNNEATQIIIDALNTPASTDGTIVKDVIINELS